MERPPNLGLVGCGTLGFAYASAYVLARLSHWLVWTGHSITGPHASSHIGVGWTVQELIFLPLTLLETWIRG